MQTAARLLSLLRVLASRTPLRLTAFAAIALAATWPLLASAAKMNDFRDAQYISLFEETARATVARFHQLPLWNPYYCGGVPALGTPSARFAAPTFLLSLAFGTLRSEALVAFASAFVGLEGAFRYTRSRGASALAAMATAPVFALCGFFARATALGWINFLGFELAPWAAFGIRAALRGSRRGAVVGAVALACMIGHGGTYTGPFMVLLGLFEVGEAAVRALAQRARRPLGSALAAILGMAALVGLLSLALSAYRLWPVAENLAAAPRVLGGSPGNDARAVWRSLFGDATFARGEMLVGVLALPVMLAAFGRRRTLPLAVAAAVWVWLALGYTANPSLFALLRHVPPYTMLRYPERYLVFFALAASAAAALGVTELAARGRKRPRWRFAVLGAVALLAGNLVLLVANAHAEAASRTMVTAPIAVEREFHQARGNRWVAMYYPAMDRGTLSCFDDYTVAQSAALRGDLTQEEALADPSAGTVTRLRWTPNEIDLRVEVSAAARVIVNQNFHPGWKSNVGTVTSDAGRLAVDVPPGSHALRVRFAPRSASGGAAVSVLGLVVAIVMWRRAGRKDAPIAGRRAWTTHLALAAAPLVAVPMAFALIREPPRPAPQLLTPSGEPLVVDALPASSPRLGVRFEGGVELEGAALHFSTMFDTPVVEVELDWKKPGAIPPGLGIFVHVDAPGESGLNADHVFLGSEVTLEDAPVGKTLRDVTAPIALPTSNARRHWTVRAGLWRARAGGARVKVVDAGRAVVVDDAVEVAAFDAP